jgi:hypothetical protein
MKRIVFVICLLAVPAWAQQPLATPTLQSLNERIGAQIGALAIENAALRLQVDQMQATLKAAQDRVKALTDKYEPKTSEK